MACESESGEGMPVWLPLCWPAASVCNCFSPFPLCTGQDLTLIPVKLTASAEQFFTDFTMIIN